jgi:hypothetical protein
MSGEDSGVDAGSNESNESVCMSSASEVSDYERDVDNEDVVHNRLNNNPINNNDNNVDNLLPNVRID